MFGCDSEPNHVTNPCNEARSHAIGEALPAILQGVAFGARMLQSRARAFHGCRTAAGFYPASWHMQVSKLGWFQLIVYDLTLWEVAHMTHVFRLAMISIDSQWQC